MTPAIEYRNTVPVEERWISLACKKAQRFWHWPAVMMIDGDDCRVGRDGNQSAGRIRLKQKLGLSEALHKESEWIRILIDHWFITTQSQSDAVDDRVL